MGRIAVSLAAVALVVLFRTEAADYPPTAARLPDLLGWAVFALAALAIAQAIYRWRAVEGAGNDAGPPFVPRLDPRALALGLGFAGLVVLYGWSIRHVGYLVATPVFLLIPLAHLRPVGWGWTLVATAATTALIWAVFLYFLRLPLPLLQASEAGP